MPKIRFRFMSELGKIGENIAARYLEKSGYDILERNFRTPAGEVDLICLDGKTLVFVEVKTRSSQDWEAIEATIDKTKINRILKTADIYIDRITNIEFDDTRIDAVFVFRADGKWQVQHYKNFY